MASLNRVEHQPGCGDARVWPDSRCHTVGLGTKLPRRRWVCETCGASSAWFPVLGLPVLKPRNMESP